MWTEKGSWICGIPVYVNRTHAQTKFSISVVDVLRWERFEYNNNKNYAY